MVRKIVASPILTLAETHRLQGKILPRGYFKTVIRSDVDIQTETGELLLRQRKNVLPQKHITEAYDSIIKHARKKTTNRGITSGDKGKTETGFNKPIMTNVIGQMDYIPIRLNQILRDAGEPLPKCRATAFTLQNPTEYERFLPLVRDIDRQYARLVPAKHRLQYAAARKTKHSIPNTAFSTVTTNVNLQTALHYDKGDFTDGFGNLVVITKGKYDGGQTGFPQYGVAIDMRDGDFMAMNVHHLHGNEPMQNKSPDAERLSLVCYLREKLVTQCGNAPVRSRQWWENVYARANKVRRRTARKPRRRRTRKRTS